MDQENERGKEEISLHHARRKFFKQSAALTAIALAPPSLIKAADGNLDEKASALFEKQSLKIEVNGIKHELSVEPRVTLLDLLREQLHLTGSKKGCDFGQCGACTVHVDGKRVLSCMSLAIMQNGKRVTTIEGLAKGDDLHPMQKAFIKHEGMQCGYCTPGQIMSAIACVNEGHANNEEDIRQNMSGNICRCGAYPNIVDAIMEAKQKRRTTMINFDYVKPSTQKAAIEALNKDATSQFIAGGTNLVDLMKRGVVSPEKLIDITSLPLKRIEQQKGFISIGALALNSDVAEHEIINKKLPLLSQALKAGASPQLRNMATVGGNMMQRTRCSYFYDLTMPCNKRQPGSGCGALKGYNRMHAIFGASEKCIAVHPSDMCVALIALDATVVISSSKGDRRIPFADFHRLPGTTPEKDNNLQRGEMITAIEVPDNDGFAKSSLYVKIRDRASYAFALVSVAAALEIKGNTIVNARLAMGGVAHKPWRLTAAENFLKGKNISLENFKQVAAIAMKDAKGEGYNNFKLKLAPNTIVQTLKTVSGFA
jgi:xanthine dehydrogenase YagS FAD-binding subunit